MLQGLIVSWEFSLPFMTEIRDSDCGLGSWRTNRSTIDVVGCSLELKGLVYKMEENGLKRSNSEECLGNNKKLVIAEERLEENMEPLQSPRKEEVVRRGENNSIEDKEVVTQPSEPPSINAKDEEQPLPPEPYHHHHLWKKPTENDLTNDLLYRLQKEGIMDITMQNTQNMMLKHRLLNSYPCDLCGRKFTKESHLKRHMIMHVEERAPAISPHLMGVINRAPHHYQHQEMGPPAKVVPQATIQNLSKYFDCELCEKKFAQASTLKNHMFTHTKEKPHACPQCGKRFALGGDLRRHLLIHTGEKPYSCEQCGKRSARLDNLKKHMQTHRREGVIV